VVAKKDTDVHLEAMEEAFGETQESCKAWPRIAQSVEIRQHKKELLAYSQ